MARYELSYHQVDVFTTRALGGNPLGIFPAAHGLGEALMQALARETNLSETTFITGMDDAREVFGVRIFTPAREMVFAGHPTVGTAWHIFQHIVTDKDEITLELPAGPVPVRIERERGFVHFNPPPHELRKVVDDTALLERLLRLDERDFDFSLSPAQIAVTGPRFLIVPVRGLGALERAACNPLALRELDERFGADQATVFCTETYTKEAVVSTRMFAPEHGVVEDPATGSSAVCLAHYLRHYNYIPDSGDGWFGIDQGYSVSRPSLIMAQANAQRGGAVAVRIGGYVLPVMTGKYSLVA